MKTRSGFVSNSSSTSFIVLIKPKEGFQLTEQDYIDAVGETGQNIKSLKETAADFLSHGYCDNESCYEIEAIFNRYVFNHFSVEVCSDGGDVHVIDEEDFREQVDSVLKRIIPLRKRKLDRLIDET